MKNGSLNIYCSFSSISQMYTEMILFMLKHTINSLQGKTVSMNEVSSPLVLFLPHCLCNNPNSKLLPPASCVTREKTGSQFAYLSNGYNDNTPCRGLSWYLTEGNPVLAVIVVEAFQIHLEMVSELINHTCLLSKKLQ